MQQAVFVMHTATIKGSSSGLLANINVKNVLACRYLLHWCSRPYYVPGVGAPTIHRSSCHQQAGNQEALKVGYHREFGCCSHAWARTQNQW
jgi:hypothetical protein